MGELPERIGLCPNRVGDSHYVVAGRFLDDDAGVARCEHCGEKLAIYVLDRTSLMADDG